MYSATLIAHSSGFSLCIYNLHLNNCTKHSTLSKGCCNIVHIIWRKHSVSVGKLHIDICFIADEAENMYNLLGHGAVGTEQFELSALCKTDLLRSGPFFLH